MQEKKEKKHSSRNNILMLEQYISSYSEQLLLSLGEKSERYALQELMKNENVPEYIRAFIQAETEWWAYTAILRKDFGNHFPVDFEQLHSAAKPLNAYLMSIAECSEEELRAMIRMSLETYVNALTRPVLTSTLFFFRNESFKSAHELLLRAEALHHGIPFLRDAIQHCIGDDARHPSLLSIGKEQFTKECMHACSSHVLKCTTQDLHQYFNPLFAFMQTIMGKEEIPVELLIAFFEEAKHVKYAEYFSSADQKSYSSKQLQEALYLAIGMQPSIQEEKHIEIKDDRTIFAEKGVLITARPRLKSKPSMRQSIPKSLTLSMAEYPQAMKSEQVIDDLLLQYQSNEQPLRLIRPSFLGSIPITVQMHYANVIFDGDLTLLRKLGARIDKTVGSQAAVMTCKAFVEQYGLKVRDSEDPLNGLCDLVETFCMQRAD